MRTPRNFGRKDVLIYFCFDDRTRPIVLQYFEMIICFEKPAFGTGLCLLLLCHTCRVQTIQLFQKVVDISNVVIQILPVTDIIGR